MTPEHAKRVLMLYRPGTADAEDPEVVEAMSLARSNPELGAWFQQHCAFQTAMRNKFRQIQAPADLKARLAEAHKRVQVRPGRGRQRQRTAWMAAAAVVLLLALAGTLLIGLRTPNRFADYRSRMVRTVLREYRMDILTNDMPAVRRFLKSGGAPSDYELTPGIDKLKLTGAGLLRWRGNPVSMVCFDRGDTNMLFLFVMNKVATKDLPPAELKVVQVKKLLTLSWTRDDKAYVLAGPVEPDFARKYR